MKLIAPIQIPWADDGNLMGAYYDTVQLLAPHFEWVPFMDHDVEILTRDWHRRLTQAIADVPYAGLITCRVNLQWQGNKGQSLDIKTDCNTKARLRHAEAIRHREDTTVLDCSINNIISGCWFAVHARRFLRHCADPPAGFWAVDNWIHTTLDRAGYPAIVIEGMLVWHRYGHLEPRQYPPNLVRLPLDLDHIYGPEIAATLRANDPTL